VVDDANLFVERCKDIAAICTKSVSENYAGGKAVLYIGLRHYGPHGHEDHFSFLIAKEVLEFGWSDGQPVDVASIECESMVQVGANLDQTFPMLVGVSNLVDGPKGIIPSRVWAVGANEVPLLRTEFLFQSVLPDHPFTWEFIGLPGVAVDAAEWEPYARSAPAIAGDERDGGLIQRGSKAQNEIHNIEGDIDVEIFLAACNYVAETRFSLSAEGVGVRLQEPVNRRFELTELALSSGDIFL